MTFPLTALPHEIIIYHLIPFLGPMDVLHVVNMCRLEVTREIYSQVFCDNTQFSHYDYEMFEHRCLCSLYIFKGDKNGCLPEHSELEHYGAKVRPLGGVVMQVSGSGSSDLEVLSSNGQIHSISHNSDGDTVVSRVEGRREVPDDFREKGRGKLVRKSKEYFDSDRQSFFSHADSSYGNIAAMDDSGLLWMWRDSNETRGAQFLLDSKTSALIRGRMLKIRMSGFFTAFQMEGRGIFVRNQVFPRVNGTRGGFPCYNGHLCGARVVTIPGTRHNVLDYVVTQDMILVLKEDGTVTGVNAFRLLEAFDPKRDIDTFADLNKLGPFVQISTGSNDTFILVCADNRIVLTRCRRRDDYVIHTHVFDDYKEDGVASVSTDWGNVLVLTKKGEVFSWTKKCYYEEMPATKPVKMVLPGKAYAVFAGRDYSAVLVYKDSSKPKPRARPRRTVKRRKISR